MEAGTPLGPGIRSLLTYPHYSRHVIPERLSRIAAELSGLTLCHGVIAGAPKQIAAGMKATMKAITDKLLTVKIIAPEETYTRLSALPIGDGSSSRKPRSGTGSTHAVRAVLPRRCWGATILFCRSPDATLDSRNWTKKKGRLRTCLARCWGMPSTAGRPPSPAGCLRGGRRCADSPGTDACRPLLQGALLNQTKARVGKLVAFPTRRDVPATKTISEREIRLSAISCRPVRETGHNNGVGRDRGTAADQAATQVSLGKADPPVGEVGPRPGR